MSELGTEVVTFLIVVLGLPLGVCLIRIHNLNAYVRMLEHQIRHLKKEGDFR
jgi:hypothetical protein